MRCALFSLFSLFLQFLGGCFCWKDVYIIVLENVEVRSALELSEGP